MTMKFYSSMAPVYDYVFPLNPAQLKFTGEEMAAYGKTASLLDVGCATGNLVLNLRSKAFHAYGMDLDLEMVDIAKAKTKENSSYFKIANMLDIYEVYGRDMFDLASCYGNTIVHLTEEDELNRFFTAVYSVLKRGGSFIGQIINYDRIIDEKISFLPTLDNEHIRFKRTYVMSDENKTLDFNTELYIKETDQTLINSVPLLPMRRHQLEKLLIESGFTNLNFYGNFNRGPLETGSQPLVFRAIKA